jgi:hypothetical protein
VEIETEAAQFLEKENINGIFVAVHGRLVRPGATLQTNLFAWFQEVEYLAYFCPAEYVYRVDRPKETHPVGRD